MKIGKHLVAGIGTATAVAVLAGCSSGSSAGTTGTTGTSASTSPTASVIKLMVVAPKNNPALSDPQTLAAAQARVDSINASGGLNGHQIKLTQCDSNFDPNKEKACLDEAVSEKMSAVVGSFMVFDPLDELNAAGIPLLAPYGLTKTQFTSPISYPLGGSVSWFLGMAAMAKADGVKTAAMASLTQAAAANSDAITLGGMKKAGITLLGNVVRTPQTAVDYSAPAAEVTKDHPDAIFLDETPQSIVGIVKAIRQTGYKGNLYTVSGSVSPQSIKSMGSAGDGLKIAALAGPITDTANAQVAAFLADMNKYAPGAAKDEFAELGWSGVDLFAQVMKNATSFTGADVMAALKQLTSPVTAGVFGPFVGAGKTGPAGYPRALNTEFAPEIVKNGQETTLGDFKDATQGTT